jgi:hypothetical protein
MRSSPDSSPPAPSRHSRVEPGTAQSQGSLVVVGTGVAPVIQATLESVRLIRTAEKVFYLVTDPITEFWLKDLNPTAESLAGLYGEKKPRQQTYRDMTARIVATVREGLAVCVAFYGHPGVLVQSTHSAIAELKAEGFPARMAPGVSADGCLYADLGINPGICGVQSFEATDFLLFGRRFDPTSILILWQIGVLGESTARPGTCRPERLQTLTGHLRRDYPASHPVVLYQAAQFPGHAADARYLRLEALADASVLPLAMLYVPPLPQRPPDPAILGWFAEPNGDH